MMRGVAKRLDSAAKAYGRKVRDELKEPYAMGGEVEAMGAGEPTDKAVPVTPEMVEEAGDGQA